MRFGTGYHCDAEWVGLRCFQSSSSICAWVSSISRTSGDSTIAALTAADVRRLRRLLWLVTAFTLGHSATLVLATLQLVTISTALVELLIPITIVATCLVTAVTQWRAPDPNIDSPGTVPGLRYLLAAVFGLVHGLGFSAFLRAALGMQDGIVLPLFAFNVGLEIGQLVVVLMLTICALVLGRLLAVSERAWALTVSTAAGFAALMMIVNGL